MDYFSHLTTIEWYRVTYCHLDIIAEVFLEGTDELSPEASIADIDTVMNWSKVTQTAKLLKQQELRVARITEEKISEKVLEDAPGDGFEEEVSNFNKGRQTGLVPVGLVLYPNSGVKPSSG